MMDDGEWLWGWMAEEGGGRREDEGGMMDDGGWMIDDGGEEGGWDG